MTYDLPIWTGTLNGRAVELRQEAFHPPRVVFMDTGEERLRTAEDEIEFHECKMIWQYV